jgi:hypothetical protein
MISGGFGGEGSSSPKDRSPINWNKLLSSVPFGSFVHARPTGPDLLRSAAVHPLPLAIPEAPSPICVPAVPAPPFLHVNVLDSELLHPRFLLSCLGAIILYLPACACAHSTADAQHHSPKVGQVVVSHRCPSVAHLAHSWYSLAHLLFQLFLLPFRRLCTSLGCPLMRMPAPGRKQPGKKSLRRPAGARGGNRPSNKLRSAWR